MEKHLKLPNYNGFVNSDEHVEHMNNQINYYHLRDYEVEIIFINPY